MTISDVPVFTDTAVPRDESPLEFDLVCKNCGKGFDHAGRGRKPNNCPECRDAKNENRPSRSTGGKRSLGTNEKLAAQAAKALSQTNGLIALGCMAATLLETSTAISAANPTFEELAYEALLTDPELCKQILKGGTASGKIALVLAYGMFAGAVVPVAMTELKEKREKRNEDRTED